MLYAISDIHGYYDLFVCLLNEVDYSPSRDELIILGDLIDRGPDSRKVIEMCMNLQDKGAIILKGNHEQMAITCLGPKEFPIVRPKDWLYLYGGNDLLESYEEPFKSNNTIFKHLGWLKTLPLFYMSHGYTFVHAAVKPGIPLIEQDEDVLLWGTEIPWNASERLVLGHTPVQYFNRHSNDPLVNSSDSVALIDSGSFFSGILTLVELPTQNPDLSMLRFCQAKLKNGNPYILHSLKVLG